MCVLKIYMCLLCFAHQTYSDWASEWMSPIQDQLYEPSGSTNNGVYPKLFTDSLRVMPLEGIANETPDLKDQEAGLFEINNAQMSTSKIKLKLEKTLINAKMLAETLKFHILEITNQETKLKDAIVNGRPGVTIVTISTMGQTPRSYIIRDGDWIMCNGVIQTPANNQYRNLLNELLATPRCIGQEVLTKRDPCAFNSVIKYEVVPTTRRFEYVEDDYLCLKVTFNNTLEQYKSVTQQVVNQTCTDGVIRSLHDNILECGIRVMSEYTFYPYKGSTSSEMPIEYCTQKDGSCKLIIAWHVSNTTIENFEFLKEDENFRKFFIKPEIAEHNIE